MSTEFDTVAGVPPPAPVVAAQPASSTKPAAAEGTASLAAAPADRTGIEAALQEANRALHAADMSFRFAYDDDTKRIVVSVLDESTGKVIRQIPSEEQLAIAARLRVTAGLFFDRPV